MKIRMTQIFLFSLIIAGVACSCSENETELKNLDLNNPQLNIAFKNSYKVSSKEEVTKIVNLFLEELFEESSSNNASGRTSDTSSPEGFEFQLEDGVLDVTPIEGGIDVNSSCGEGWTNHGVCYSSGCVSDKVEKAMAPIENSEGCVQVKVIRTTTHARVCSKSC